jgi:DNA-binding NarL/FixJ family response regulator
MSDQPTIKVLVADDQWLIREGIASLVEIEEGIEVVGTAGDGREAVEQASSLKPDIVLMDVRMPVMNGIEATAEIRRRLPACKVVMLTTFDDEEYIVQSLLAGACGYLMKDIPAHDLGRAIRLAHAGIFQLAPEVAGKLVGTFRKQGKREPAPAPQDIPLTPREMEVLRLLATGATNREMAEQLVVSEGTIKNYVSSILQTLGLRDRTQAAVYAVEHNLV